MLNGTSPIIIFHFYVKPATDFLSGLGSLGASIADAVGFPIPIYLDEKLTGVYVDSESKAVDLQTHIEAVEEKDETNPLETKTVNIEQTVLGSTVSVTLMANKGSILLSVLLAILPMILKRAKSKEYGITYLNRSTTIFSGLLQRYSTTEGANDDLVRIDLTFSNPDEPKPTPKAPVSNVLKNTATLPGLG